MIVARNEPWLAYSSDGIVKSTESIKLLEIKCPYELNDTDTETLLVKCNRFLIEEDGELEFLKKHQYYGQVQCGLAILKLKTCDFVIYSSISKTIRIAKVDFDKEFACDLLRTVKEKYFNKMLHNVCVNSRVL